MQEQIKEEAERLIEKFYNYQAHQVSVETRKAVAKKHSLICIDEILNSNNTLFKSAYNIEHDCCKYWQQVKQYIEDNY